LRDSGYLDYGEWKCHGLPEEESIAVTLFTLVTDRSNGGSGFSSSVKVSYSNPAGGDVRSAQVFLQNPLPKENPDNSHGVGYQTTGYLVIPGKFIGADGSLNLRVERFSPQEYHVGINANSLRVVRPQQATKFEANVNSNSGWYWLRDAAFEDEGVWTWHGLPPQIGDFLLVLEVLVTQGENGGSGYSTPVAVTLLNPASGEKMTYEHVLAQNTAFEQKPANSGGSGYQAFGSLLVNDRFISSNGELIVSIKRPMGTEYHLAINEKSVGIVQTYGSDAETSGSELVEPTTVAPEDEAACEALGGKWGRIGLAPKESCNLPTTDGGKTCRDWSDCESACIANLTVEQFDQARHGALIEATGACAEWMTVVGCQPFLEDGVVRVICID
jgi:hypothetical protein